MSSSVQCIPARGHISRAGSQTTSSLIKGSLPVFFKHNELAEHAERYLFGLQASGPRSRKSVNNYLQWYNEYLKHIYSFIDGFLFTNHFSNPLTLWSKATKCWCRLLLVLRDVVGKVQELIHNVLGRWRGFTYLSCQSNHCDVTVPGAEALTLLFIAACLHKLCILWSYCSVLERKRASLLPEQFVRRQATSGTSWEMCADHTCYRTWSVQACTINTIIQ